MVSSSTFTQCAKNYEAVETTHIVRAHYTSTLAWMLVSALCARSTSTVFRFPS